MENLKAKICYIDEDYWIEFYIANVKFDSILMCKEKAIILCEKINHVFDKYKKD